MEIVWGSKYFQQYLVDYITRFPSTIHFVIYYFNTVEYDMKLRVGLNKKQMEQELLELVWGSKKFQ